MTGPAQTERAATACGLAAAMASIPPRRLIGVLGGMGPAATVDFMSKIVMATPAAVDQDHVPLIVHSVPQIPDRSSSITAGSDAPFLPLLAGARMLQSSGVELIAIPCNTAHHWYNRLARACETPILHIADAVRDAMQTAPANPGRVALMATRGTIAAGIYDRLAMTGVDLLIPDEPTQQRVDQAIARVKGSDHTGATREAVAAAEALIAAGTGTLLLACTELPVAMAGAGFASMCIDATDALAHACVNASIQPRPPFSRWRTA